jgi:AraC-like DNA-binding protein
MRAKLEHITGSDSGSFRCFSLSVPAFPFVWHYHPEYELTYISKGNGKRIVGDNISSFRDGDLVLLGPNLPHTWVSEGSNSKSGKALVLQFSSQFADQVFFPPELNDIKKMLVRSATGIQFTPRLKSAIPALFQQLLVSKGAFSISSFIALFAQLSEEKNKIICSQGYAVNKTYKTENRINKIFQYVNKDFDRPISLTHAAKILHLSESAFCKFFKRATGKTFSSYVNDVRIAHAATKLIETDIPVSTIAAECGFENLAYFNRVFLRKKKVQPAKFRSARQV